ncbi:MAG: hypothetical protein JSW28_08905 [Thermoplasmata archaeon]|nr:MAG: hypothetical protein JSW28_08905 [Thermoplasmata archaeon]
MDRKEGEDNMPVDRPGEDMPEAAGHMKAEGTMEEEKAAVGMEVEAEVVGPGGTLEVPFWEDNMRDEGEHNIRVVEGAGNVGRDSRKDAGGKQGRKGRRDTVGTEDGEGTGSLVFPWVFSGHSR